VKLDPSVFQEGVVSEVPLEEEDLLEVGLLVAVLFERFLDPVLKVQHRLPLMGVSEQS
jgi:hypothetical protein